MTVANVANVAIRKSARPKSRSEGWGAIVFRQLRKNRGAMGGLAVLAGLVIVALVAPIIAPYDPVKQSRDALEAPSASHPMGTDPFGRDLLSRVIYGSRVSLRIGFISVAIGATVGLVLGLIGGYHGGRIDAALVMFVDTLLAFPGMLLALAIAGVLGPGLSNVMIAVGIASVPRYARLIRGCVLSAKEEVYVVAARVIGCSDMRIMFRHILPNVMASLVVFGTLNLATAILSAAGLSFLGLGAQPPTAEWGLMVSNGRKFLRVGWWITTFPGLAIMVTVLSINLLGDGLRDALDPRLRID
jgi:peptide/nickel transport system permease protein